MFPQRPKLPQSLLLKKKETIKCDIALALLVKASTKTFMGICPRINLKCVFFKNILYIYLY